MRRVARFRAVPGGEARSERLRPGRREGLDGVLVVDDDDNVRRLVSAYLEREGYQVIEAADGAAALRAVDVSAPDLVVLDLMLPGTGGLQVARRISAARELPILMLTARGDEDDVLRGFEAGADDYLIKPFSPRVLVATSAGDPAPGRSGR